MARVKRKTVKKAADPSAARKQHWKRPGFNAFGAQSSVTSKKGVIKFARCTEVEPPETGIHSLSWAKAIVPQNCGLLKLPVEVRHKIWNLVFEDLSCGDGPIKPMKRRKRFYSPTWPDAARETAVLSETCRQIYVDVVGGGLLYKAKQFSFTPGLMLNYLWVINPVHKNSIRSIRLNIKVGYRSFSPPTKAFAMLTDLPGLQDLHLEFSLDSSLCYAIPWINPPFQHIGGHDGRRIPETTLNAIRTCTALREIKGLQSFRLTFVTYDRMPRDGRNHSNYTIYEYRQFELSGGSSGPYYDLEKELQELLLVQK